MSAMARLCCKTRLLFCNWAGFELGHLVAFSAESAQRRYRFIRLADWLSRTDECGRWRWAAAELDEAPQVLSGCGQQHLISDPAQASQPQPVELEDALHMRKLHLDLFAFPA